MRRPGFDAVARFGASLIAAYALAAAAAARADDAAAGDAAAPPETAQRFAVHFQSTFTVQGASQFASPYRSTNSLPPGDVRETFDATLFAGFRPWHGAEIWVNPEIDQGFGLANTLGVAGFPSAEAYKVGKSEPYFKLSRLFVRQTIDLGGTAAAVEGAANQLRGRQTSDRLVLTFGKFSMVDIFDTNAYAHDPRGDFLNWSLIDAGAFDYAANAWGFTFGGAAELYTGAWTLRAGLFDLSKVPNQPSLEVGLQQYQVAGEIEHRHTIGGHPGTIRFGAWFTRGNLARLRDLIAAYQADGGVPITDNAPYRRKTDKYGAYLGVEQEVTTNLGLFARASAGDGTVEADDFTDIDRSVALGAQLAGAAWGRKSDKVGAALVANGISRLHQIFLSQGGLGTLVGDGQLPHAADEFIGEAWYQLGLDGHITVTADYQLVVNPAYNRDRGPANIFALRLHVGL